MARPRTPAKVLELRGAFQKDPQRRRQDAEGAGPWSDDPPAYLTGPEIAAWRDLVEMLPKVALSRSDRMGVEQMARLWAALKATNPFSSEFTKLDAALNRWAVQMGMTVQARTKLTPSGNDKPDNPFNEFGQH